MKLLGIFRRFQSQPLSLIVAVGLAFIALIPITFLGVKLYDAAWQNAWREVDEKHRLLAENLTQPVSIYVKDHHSLLSVLSLELGEAGYSSGDVHHALLLSNTLRSFPDFHSLTWADSDGRVIAYFDRNGSASPISQGVGDNETFRKAIATRKWQVANTYRSPLSGQPALLMVKPVMSPAEELVGVLIAELDTGVLERLRRNIKFGEKGHSAFVDENGRVIAHPNPAWAEEMRDLSKLNVVQDMMAGKTGSTEFYSPFVKETMVAGYSAVPELGWGIMVPQPKGEIERQVRSLIASQFFWGGVGLVLAFMLGLVIARSVTRPVNLLAKGARDLLRSDFRAPLPETPKWAPKEIKQLGDALHAVTEGFQQSQSKITELNQSLQRRVDEATEQLRDANVRLADALEQANQASYAKSAFLASMSHELRTPLNAIIGYGEMLSEDALVESLPGAVEDLDKIQTAAKHLLSLINNVLDLSKIEAGKMDIYLEEFPLALLIQDACATAAPLMERGHNRLKTIIDSDIDKVTADATKLRQILLNLLSNAAKFTDYGDICVHARRVVGGDRPFVAIDIRDSGVGMTEPQLASLFQDFTQADASTSRNYGGTGLGLSISRRFCRLMGGDITAVSHPGKGSTFTVTLPADVAAALAVPDSKTLTESAVDAID